MCTREIVTLKDKDLFIPFLFIKHGCLNDVSLKGRGLYVYSRQSLTFIKVENFPHDDAEDRQLPNYISKTLMELDLVCNMLLF